MIDLNDARKQDNPGIVLVIDYFDEEHIEPANYVVKLATGGYEAMVFDRHGEVAVSLGVWITCNEASRMIRNWNDLEVEFELVPSSPVPRQKVH